MNQEFFLKIEIAAEKLQSHRKLWAYVRFIVETDEFQKDINGIRKELLIPENGFEEDYDPREWDNWSLEKSKKLNKKIENLCTKYYLYLLDFEDTLRYYILKNIFQPLNSSLDGMNYITFDLIAQDMEDDLEDKKINYLDEIDRSKNQIMPIALRFSQYATKRDLIDYVERMYPYINHFQEHFKNPKIKLGKIRPRKDPKIAERNKFIYEHRTLPIREIRKLLTEKKIFLDDGLISKIISIEKKKRMNV